MSDALLGPSFDIHAGGIDLQFPHHENEIAQSMCVHPEAEFAKVWMHNEMLQVEGKKMSKSLGNFFTVRDLLDKGVPGEVIRFVLLGTHYSKPMDWTERKREEAEATLRDWVSLTLGVVAGDVDESVLGAVADDLNTAEAIAELGYLYKQNSADTLLASANVLGFDLAKIANEPWARLFQYEHEDGNFLSEGADYQPTVGVLGWGNISDEVRDAASRLVLRWLGHRRSGDFAKADALKGAALNNGVELRAVRSSNGINGGQAILKGSIDPAKLEALI
jgi:cysteinyl-tRNA synthetase